MLIESNCIAVEGFKVYSNYHGDVILNQIFPEAKRDIELLLRRFSVPRLSIVKGCGNECTFIKRFKESFEDLNWSIEVNGVNSQSSRLVKKISKTTFDRLDEESRTKVGNSYFEILLKKELESSTHKIDIIKSFDKGSVGIDIEWNSKDSVFDRDLTNFQWLYQYEFISVGIIITRGESLVEELKRFIEDYYQKFMPFEFERINQYSPDGTTITNKQIKRIRAKDDAGNVSGAKAIAAVLYQDKYGESTTHYSKLANKIVQGKGGFCPIVVITIEKDRVV